MPKYTASSAFIEKRDEAQTALNRLRKFTKFKFSSDTEATNTLQLGVSLPTKFADWLQAAKYFYQRLLAHPEWITQLEPFGYTTESFTALQATLSEIETLQEARLRETGDAQRATLTRNSKFDELQSYCTELRNLAKLVFEDEDAQFLEKLGILIRS